MSSETGTLVAGTYAFPASFAQRRLWFIEQAEESEGAYNETFALRFRGTMEPQHLAEAISYLEHRHEVLRTTLALTDGEVTQVVRPPGQVTLRVDSQDSQAPHRGHSLQRRIEAEAAVPFDLGAGPLVRATLYPVAPGEHILVITMHHSIVDAWSINIIIDELAQAYAAISAGRAPALDPLPIQYADYSVWQLESLSKERLDKDLEYWRKQLAEPLPMLALPIDRPRPPSQTHHGARLAVDIGPEIAEPMRRLARESNATLFMTLLATFQVFLYRHTGQVDLITGTPIAGRQRSETAGLIGFFLNTLAIRTDMSGDPGFRELLTQVRRTVLDAFAGQGLPFERLVEALQIPRDWSRHPLFQAVFVLHEPDRPLPDFPGLAVERMPVPQSATSKFDLLLTISDSGHALRAEFEYNTDLFEPATVERMAERYLVLLKELSADPDQTVGAVPILPDAELHLLEAWAGSATSYPRDATIPELFEKQVRTAPLAVAVSGGGISLSYRTLDERANRLAHHIREAGVKRGSMVGVMVRRSPDLLVALLAILKADAVYVPLDPSYPAARLEAMATAAGVHIVITTDELSSRLPATPPGGTRRLIRMDSERTSIAKCPLTPPLREGTATDAAYLMFTSGSTGMPKGVVIPHRGVVRLVKETNFVPREAFARVLGYAPVSFDASTLELWGPLLNGGTSVILSSPLPSLAEIGKFIAKEHITTVWLTAALFHQMVDTQLEKFAGVEYLLAGGDVLSPAHVQQVLTRFPGCRVINGYGPTENTTFTCCHQVTAVEPGHSIPIGRPISNTFVHLLDNRMGRVPIGVSGELYTGGDGVALGYFGEPALTAEQFVPDPFQAGGTARLYRTGDRARWLADGTIEFLGRADDQVKIRGYRIEPSDVTASLLRHPEVAEAVTVLQGAGISRLLMSYFVARSGQPLGESGIRAFLESRLPPFMVPSAVIQLAALPMTPNGKLDRTALPARQVQSPDSVHEESLPNTTMELVLVEMWTRLLDRKDIGTHDDFFELGGHSLLAARMVDDLERATGLRLPMSALFQGATIQRISEYLLRNAREQDQSSLIEVQQGQGGRPFFMVHGDMTGAGFYCREVARVAGSHQTMYAVPPYIGSGATSLLTIKSMATFHLNAIRRVQPHGPYLLGGYCAGGLVAYEMAQQLTMMGESIELLFLIDSAPVISRPGWLAGVLWGVTRATTRGETARLDRFAYLMQRVQNSRVSSGWRQSLVVPRLAVKSATRRLARLLRLPTKAGVAAKRSEPSSLALIVEHHRRAMLTYQPLPYAGRVDLVWTVDGTDGVADPDQAWRLLAREVTSRHVAATHIGVVWSHLPELLAEALARAQSGGSKA